MKLIQYSIVFMGLVVGCGRETTPDQTSTAQVWHVLSAIALIKQSSVNNVCGALIPNEYYAKHKAADLNGVFTIYRTNADCLADINILCQVGGTALVTSQSIFVDKTNNIEFMASGAVNQDSFGTIDYYLEAMQ